MMRVACVQIAAYDLSRAKAGLQRALEMIDQAALRGADLIVLPECTYPAYFLRGKEDYVQAGLRPWDDLLEIFGRKASEHRCHLIVGMVRTDQGRKLSKKAGPSSSSPPETFLNAAVLFGPDGKMIGSTAKSFLWHFDQHWFSPGREYRVFDTSIGRLGVLVCADGRMPEIARVLALQGAQVIVDPTAWVTGGSELATLSNPQFEYMIPVRALENGVWFVAANKVGLESDTVLYCGRSCVVDPSGNKVVTASPDREEVVVADVDLARAAGIPVDRRPEVYRSIAEPTKEQPVARLLHQKVEPGTTAVRMAAFQLADQASASDYLRRVEGLLDTVSRQDVRLVVLPGSMPVGADVDAARAGEVFSRLAGLSARFKLGLAATTVEYDGQRRYRACYLWDSGKLVGKYRKAHPDDLGITPGDKLPVFETPFGRLGIMLDDEGLLPEVPRCLMLKGADTILWPTRSSKWPLQLVARSRADENKVHVVLAAPVGGGTALINPAGAVMAEALPDVEQVVAAQVAWAFSRYKEMAPHTHVVWGRMPELYGGLVR